jgi:hypothetical protein
MLDKEARKEERARKRQRVQQARRTDQIIEEWLNIPEKIRLLVELVENRREKAREIDAALDILKMQMAELMYEFEQKFGEIKWASVSVEMKGKVPDVANEAYEEIHHRLELARDITQKFHGDVLPIPPKQGTD